MKKFIIILLLPVFVSITAFAQSDNTNKFYFSPDTNVKYRLFKTQNMHIFIKLDTSNGTMKLVQFSTSSIDNMMEVTLNEKELATGTEAKNGRFFLYPTDNFYTFLLLDQITGRVWQVQWSINPEDQGIFPIF